MPDNSEITPKTSKPVTSTPVMTPLQEGKFLAKVPEERVFRSSDGRVLRDMQDLRDALADISDQTFAYHANAARNDFSNWVREVLGDHKLAKDLDKACNREEAARIVDERYRSLVHNLGK